MTETSISMSHVGEIYGVGPGQSLGDVKDWRSSYHTPFMRSKAQVRHVDTTF